MIQAESASDELSTRAQRLGFAISKLTSVHTHKALIRPAPLNLTFLLIAGSKARFSCHHVLAAVLPEYPFPHEKLCMQATHDEAVTQ